MNEPTGRAKGGISRANTMTADERKEAASNAAKARWEPGVLKATHGSADHPLRIGDLDIPCYVLEDGRRVLSLGGMTKALGMSSGGAGGGKEGDRLTAFASGKAVSPFISSDLLNRMKTAIRFRAPSGGAVASGYEATILADLCDAVLEARREGALRPQQEHIAQQCEILVRGFARVGIIALIDEATGYQKDRARDALAKILEAFVAKELQPYVKTFPADYYEQLFRLYRLPYPPAVNKSWRPAFFGHVTNEVIYSRLAPDLLPELKKIASKAERKAKLHQWLTNDVGHPKLREHLASIIAIQKLSSDPQDFIAKVDLIHPRYERTKKMDIGMSDLPENQ
jgi:hypothetical protein